MPITDSQSGTRIDEVAPDLYRITTPLPPSIVPGGFSLNRYLLVDSEPLLFHTGLRRMAPLTIQAIEAVMPVSSLRYIGFSHVEADECGALNELLAAAPGAVPLCGQIASMLSISDMADRPPKTLGDGETLALGRYEVQWFDAPHLPHSWDCGYLMETKSKTFFCGDLFTQPGDDTPPITEGDILGPSEAFRHNMEYFAHSKSTQETLERFAREVPVTLACMHGSAWHGDGASLLRELGRVLN